MAIENAGPRNGRSKLERVGLALLLALTAAAAPAENLVTNGWFHHNRFGWDLLDGSDILWTDLSDGSDCTNSGSVIAISELQQGQHVARIGQCLGLLDETFIFGYARYRGDAASLTALLTSYFSDDCSGAAIGEASFSFSAIDSWRTAEWGGSLPAGVRSLYVSFTGIDPAPHGLNVDEVIVTGDYLIFLDGFDGNDSGTTAPCRWSP